MHLLTKRRGFRNIAAMHKQAQRIVDKFGGPRRLAYAAGLEPSRVYRWLYPKARGGTGGIIPSAAVAQVQQAALVANVDLTPEDWAP